MAALTNVPRRSRTSPGAHERPPALTNVVRHARAPRRDVRLWRGVGALLVRITDDGGGPLTGYRAGIGITAMWERVTELGGTVTVGPGTVTVGPGTVTVGPGTVTVGPGTVGTGTPVPVPGPRFATYGSWLNG